MKLRANHWCDALVTRIGAENTRRERAKLSLRRKRNREPGLLRKVKKLGIDPGLDSNRLLAGAGLRALRANSKEESKDTAQKCPDQEPAGDQQYSDDNEARFHF